MPGVAVADVPARALGGGLHLLAQLVVERRRRRLLDQLLVAALDRALALAAGEDVAVVVAEHLDLDVARRRDHLLDVQRAVPERGLRLGRGALVGVVERRRAPSTSRMPLPPPPAAAFSSTGKPSSSAAASASSGPAIPSVPGTSGTPAARISAFARALSPIRSITLGRRADEDEVVVLARADEVGVLGDEAVAGMDGLAAGRLGRRDERRDAEVALGGGRRADPHRAVGEPDVQRVLVRGRVDRDRLDAELVQGADHADGDLPPVRYEDAVEHDGSLWSAWTSRGQLEETSTDSSKRRLVRRRRRGPAARVEETRDDLGGDVFDQLGVGIKCSGHPASRCPCLRHQEDSHAFRTRAAREASSAAARSGS